MDSMTNQYEKNELFNEISLASQDLPSAALYVIGLPIGNLGDITLRALWVLSHMDAVGAEDTRETHKLLGKFNIDVPLFAVHQHNEHEGASKILLLLKEGKKVGIVTDAGTPAVSDPGSKVVATVQEEGFKVIPIPGACAAVTAMSAAGMAPEGFIFEGFLPSGSQERLQTLRELRDLEKTFIVYEAPHRILKLAKELSEIFAEKTIRKIVIARELTKKFEQITALNSAEILDWSKHHEPKGEYVVVVNAPQKEKNSELDPVTLQWLQNLYTTIPTRQLSEIASSITGFPKKTIYDLIVDMKKQS